MTEELERFKAAFGILHNHISAQIALGHLCGGARSEARNVLQLAAGTIQPPHKMETVEVKGWFVVPTEGDVFTQVSEEEVEQMRDRGHTVIEVSAPSKRPVKRVVVREVSVEALIGDGMGFNGWTRGAARKKSCPDDTAFADYPECHGKTGKLIFQWTE